ncbi:MAG: hypothetical protein WC389_15290 [Lutibacter sp.]|jgi:hypothetical protein
MFEDPKYLNDTFQVIRTPNPNKTYDYFLKNCQFEYSTIFRGGAYLTYSSVQKFAQLRAFANGMQDEDFYKRYLSKQKLEDNAIFDKTLGYVGNSRRAKGFMRPLWQIMSPASKIVNSMIGTLTKTQTDISADPIDALSKSKIEDAKLDLWVTSQNIDILKKAHQVVGLDMQTPDFIPENQEELELYNDMGGFKPAFARVMEKLITHTTDISEWKVIEDRLYRDIIALNVMGVREYYDPEVGKYRSRVVDPARAGCQYSEYNDCRSSEWAYEFRDESISTILQYFPDKTEEDLQALAFMFCGYMGNPQQSEWKNYTGKDVNGFRKFDFFKVPVMDCCWIDNEDEKFVEQKTKYRSKIFRVDYTEKIDENYGKKEKFSRKRFVYNATWIIGTNDIYNWGKANDQMGETRLPYHFYVGDGKSIIEQLIPLFHNFQVLWLKYLNALALSVNSGYWIDADMLANVAIGGDTGNKEDDKETALRRFMDTGIGFYSRISSTGTQTLQNMPLNEFKGGMGQIFVDIMAAFQFNMKMVESITGINPIMLGSTPNPNAPVGTTEMAVSAVSSILKPLLDGYMSVKLGMAKNICRLIHICIHAYHFSRKQYAMVVGEFDIEVLMEANRDMTEYAIRLDVRPGELEKQQMIQEIQKAISVDRDGNTNGLTGLEALILIRRLESGIPMSQIELEFEYRRRRNIREAQKIARDNSQQQNDLMQQSAIQAAQLKEEEARKKHERDMELQKLKNEGLLQATALQECARKEKESATESIKSETNKIIAQIKADAQKNTDSVKSETAKEIEDKKQAKLAEKQDE